MQKFKINFNIASDPESSGQRLDNYLVRHLKKLPKSFLYRLLRQGAIRVNKKRVKPCYKLQANDHIFGPEIDLPEFKTPISASDKLLKQLKANILYEDPGLIILNKPANLAVHGGSGLNFGIIEAMREIYGTDLELVHRLDKDTSGCLMLARKRSTLRLLHKFLREKKITKNYYALCAGKFPNKKNLIVKNLLQKNILRSGERMVNIVEQEGQEAVTKFNLIRYYPQYNISLIAASPITGRTHQIRVHAKSLGHPILGDSKYGDRKFLTNFKPNRLYLHAIELICQQSELNFKISSPLPWPIMLN